MHVIQDILTVINNLIMPVGNLGYTRNTMPQIDNDQTLAFIEYLHSHGVEVTPIHVATKHLRLTQNEINKLKVFEVMQRLRKGKKMEPFFYSKDRYVLDGSHRFVGQYNIDKEKKVLAWRVDMPMMALLKLANLFPGVRHRTVSDRKLEKAPERKWKTREVNPIH